MKEVKELIRHLEAMKCKSKDEEMIHSIDYAIEKAKETLERLREATEILKEIKTSL